MDETQNTKTIVASAGSRIVRRPPPPPAKTQKRLNWPYVFLSIVIGTLLWFGVDLKRMEEMTLEVPIQYDTKLPSNWTFVWQPQPVVKVTVRGTRQDIATLRNKDGISLVPDFPPGAFDSGDLYDGLLTLQTSHVIGLPAGIEVLSLEPSTTPIHLTKTVTRFLPVKPGPVVGTPEEGYIVGKNINIDPPALLVTASQEFLSHFDAIHTREFSVDGAKGTVGKMVDLEPLRKDQELVEVAPGSVYMTVELEEIPVEREFSEVFEVRALLDSPFDRYAGLNISPPSVKVTVSGPRSVIDKLSPGEIVIYADLRDRVPAAAGEYNIKCRAITPSRIRVTRIEPDTVKWITREGQPPEPSLFP